MTRSLKILIADDEEIVRMTILEFLENLGHRVDEATDGRRALAAIQSADYDLALVDVRMPGLDGLAFLTASREVRPRLRVVLISGHGDPGMVEQATELGAARFLHKPFRLTELEALVFEVCPDRETGPEG